MGLRAGEGFAEEEEFGGSVIADETGEKVAGGGFGAESEIDERKLEA